MYKVLFLFILLSFGSICNATDYSAIDRYAQTAPQASSESKLRQTVMFLTRPYSTDTEKARALLAWLVYNFDYNDFQYQEYINDVQHHRTSSTLSPDLWKTRLGVCTDFAELYVKMLKMINIKSHVVSGYAGYDVTKKHAEEYRHAWVYAEIEREDVFIDPTWAMTAGSEKKHITTKSEYRADLRKRRAPQKTLDTTKSVKSEWFLVPPEKMIKTHFPDQVENQFLTRKISWHEFLMGQKKQ